MQGQEDQPWESLSDSRKSFPDGTSKHRILQNPEEGTSKHRAIKEQISQRTSAMRAIPKRPPGMARIDTPPELPRAPRPQHAVTPPKSLHKRLLIWGSIFAILAIIACTIGFFLASGISNSSGPSVAATDFLSTINTQNYAQAYKDLGPAITIRISQDQFTSQSQSIDKCYGTVKDYAEVANSAQSQDDGQTYSYVYTITRTKLAKPYKLQLTLQKNVDDDSWRISDYGINLGPGQPAPACSK